MKRPVELKVFSPEMWPPFLKDQKESKNFICMIIATNMTTDSKATLLRYHFLASGPQWAGLPWEV